MNRVWIARDKDGEQKPIKTCDQIYKWLQDNKVYDLFKGYLERDGKNINTYTRQFNGSFYITFAFLWGSTRQGNKFWYKVSEKFQKWYGKEDKIMIRARFYIKKKDCNNDYRPIKWPIKYPYWCTGESSDCFIIVAYADNVEQIMGLWPEACFIEPQKVNKIEFTSRFPRPKWYKEETE